MSKTTRKSTIVTSSSSSSGSGYTSPLGGGSVGQAQRPRSPLSPTRFSRLQEKNELQNLNDRLACYMDKVRALEAENNRLTRQVRVSQESISREVSSFKSMYDQELADARRLLDDIAKERAQTEIDNKRLSEENEELKSSLEKKTKECRSLEASLTIHEHRVADLQSKYNQAIADRKKLDDELKEALKELDKLRKSYDLTKKYIESETLTRVELENKLQSLKEEMNFKDQMYQKEISELRIKRTEEISEIDGRLVVEYEDKLQAALQELRDQHEQQQLANREEIMALYESKIKNLQDHYLAAASQSSAEELRAMQAKYSSLNGQIAGLESANAALNIRVKELEKLLEAERSRKMEQLSLMEAELARLRQEMADQLKDYHDLMDIKVALDTEISAYRKLLEFEESRLNITPGGGGGGNMSMSMSMSGMGGGINSGSGSGSSSSIQMTRRGTPIRRTPLVKGGTKRRRIFLEESQEADSFQVSGEAKGDIEISDVDHRDGKFIQLYNKSDKEISLGGWTIKHSGGSEDTETTFKFHRSVKIDGKGNVTVWSMDSGRTHNPPENIVMKQKWFMGDSVNTILINNEGEEVASRSRQRIQYSSSAFRREREGSEETQDGDPKRDSCLMM